MLFYYMGLIKALPLYHIPLICRGHETHNFGKRPPNFSSLCLLDVSWPKECQRQKIHTVWCLYTINATNQIWSKLGHSLPKSWKGQILMLDE